MSIMIQIKHTSEGSDKVAHVDRVYTHASPETRERVKTLQPGESVDVCLHHSCRLELLEEQK